MMKKIYCILLFMVPVMLFGQEKFEDYFDEGVFRFDFLLTGTSNTVKVTELQQKKEPVWGGVSHMQIDQQSMGNYRFSVRDLESQKLIFRQGFSPIFQEWQTTAEAKKMERAFYEVLRFPFPKKRQ
jgi:hypothetical protein